MQVEAIQCFPCYVKVTLVKANQESGQSPLIVRITIPGLHVQLAASRTKPHCYGLFWKSNRKRCSIFLAFPSDQDRCLHMNWLKEAIQDLERYRQGEYYSKTGIPGPGFFLLLENPLGVCREMVSQPASNQSTVGGRLARVYIIIVLTILLRCCTFQPDNFFLIPKARVVNCSLCPHP